MLEALNKLIDAAANGSISFPQALLLIVIVVAMAAVAITFIRYFFGN